MGVEKIYCIYTDTEIERNKSNPEHIIPLALGGSNKFTILVEAVKNSELGSAIDGKLANDFLMTLIRSKKGFKGHNKTEVTPTLKKTKIGRENPTDPAQIIFNKEKVEIFSHKNKRLLSDEEVRNVTIESSFGFERFLRICFNSKVLLAAGYFIYGDIFRKYADHTSLRKLMNLNITETESSIKNLPLKIYDPFHKLSDENKAWATTFKFMCELASGSCVIFMLTQENIIGSVGIGGEYLGSIVFNAKTEFFPNEDDFRLGQTIVILDREVYREGFYNVVEKISKNLDIG